MPAVTIRNLPVETHRSLKSRAKLKGTSTEAEIRNVLEEAVHTPKRIKVGSVLKAFGAKYGGWSSTLNATRAQSNWPNSTEYS